MTSPDEERRELEVFLLFTEETVAGTIAALNRGETPERWTGNVPPTTEEMQALRITAETVQVAVTLLRTGASYDEVLDYLGGTNSPN